MNYYMLPYPYMQARTQSDAVCYCLTAAISFFGFSVRQ